MTTLDRAIDFLTSYKESLPPIIERTYISSNGKQYTREVDRERFQTVIDFIRSWELVPYTPSMSRVRPLMISGLFYDGASSLYYREDIESFTQRDLTSSILCQAILYLTGNYFTFPINPTRQKLIRASYGVLDFYWYFGLSSTRIDRISATDLSSFWSRCQQSSVLNLFLPSKYLGNYFYELWLCGLLQPHEILEPRILSREETPEGVSLTLNYRPIKPYQGEGYGIFLPSVLLRNHDILISKSDDGYKLCNQREDVIQAHSTAVSILRDLEL